MPNRKKILILTTFFRPFIGGAEISVEEIFKRLKDKFDFTILTARMRRDLPIRDDWQGIPVYRLGFGFKFDKYLFPLMAWWRSFRLSFDLTYAVMASYAGLAAFLIKKSRGKNYILNMQSGTLDAKRRRLKFIHTAAYRIHAISHSLKQRALDFGIDDELIEVISNGVDLDKFKDISIERKEKSVIVVSRLEKIKGVDVLIRSARKVLELHPESEFIIAGDGFEKGNLERLAGELGVLGSVRFLGRVERDELPKIMNGSSIFVCPSLAEGFGIVCAEAMACGLSVVASRVGGIPDIVQDRENGFLVEPGNVEELTKKILFCFNNKDEVTRVAERSLESVKRFSWINVADRVSRLLSEAALVSRVLIPAMDKRSALAATRALGRLGIEVVGCSHTKLSSAFYSKYCAKSYLYTSPFKSVNQYLDDLEDIIEKEKPDVFLPMNDETLLPVLENRSRFEDKIKIPVVDNGTFYMASDKIASFNLANSIGLPCPSQFIVKEYDELVNRASSLEYPLVVRPSSSRLLEGDSMRSASAKVVFSQNELFHYYHALTRAGFGVMLQKYFNGEGCGYFALCDQGRVKAEFMMRRINEVPWYGGPGSFRESFVDSKLTAYGRQILEKLKWHGVAMVEFRRDSTDGQFKFIEINGRFWGSLGLAIKSGVNFPYLLSKLAMGADIPAKKVKFQNKRTRWLTGDVSWLMSLLREKKLNPPYSRTRAICRFFKLFFSKTSYDYWEKNDIKPIIVEPIFTVLRKLT